MRSQCYRKNVLQLLNLMSEEHCTKTNAAKEHLSRFDDLPIFRKGCWYGDTSKFIGSVSTIILEAVQKKVGYEAHRGRIGSRSELFLFSKISDKDKVAKN